MKDADLSRYESTLLTSPEAFQPVHPVAVIMHDAKNKLSSIWMNADAFFDEMDPEIYESIILSVETVRRGVSSVSSYIVSGELSNEELCQMVINMRQQLLPVASVVRSLAGSHYLPIKDDILQAVSDFDSLMERGERELKASSLNPESVCTDLSPYIAAILESYRRVYPSIHFRLSVDSSSFLTFYPDSLKAAIENLLNNAIESMPGQKGIIQVRLSEENFSIRKKPFDTIADGSYSSLEIEDNGSGIPEQVLKSIAHSRVTTKAGGSGLGLISARNCVANHGGHLILESAPGVGTRVTALLPHSIYPKEPSKLDAALLSGDINALSEIAVKKSGKL